jgi:hypothetical protein
MRRVLIATAILSTLALAAIAWAVPPNAIEGPATILGNTTVKGRVTATMFCIASDAGYSDAGAVCQTTPYQAANAVQTTGAQTMSGKLTATGGITTNQLAIYDGGTTLLDLTVTGAASLTSTLSVTGATNLGASGARGAWQTIDGGAGLTGSCVVRNNSTIYYGNGLVIGCNGPDGG